MTSKRARRYVKCLSSRVGLLVEDRKQTRGNHRLRENSHRPMLGRPGNAARAMQQHDARAQHRPAERTPSSLHHALQKKQR